MAKRIFVTYTPFHILTACGLASELGTDEENILIIFKDFPNSDAYYDAIMQWKANPFKNIIIFDAGTQLAQKTLKQRFGFSRVKLTMIKRFWREHLKDDAEGYHVYTFNDDTVESQFLFWKNIKEHNYYLEDGVSSYFLNPNFSKLNYLFKKIIRKVLFGSWVERPYPYGTSKKLSKVFSFYPDRVVEQLKSKELVKLKPSIFDLINANGLIDILCKLFHLDEIKESNQIGIILLPVSTYLEAEHIDIQAFTKSIIAYFASRTEQYNEIYLKCHPREPESLRQTLTGRFPQLKLVENSASAEILFLKMRSKAKNKILLVGPDSTAFLTARVILGDLVEIICVKSSKSEAISNFFEKMNIKSISLS